MVSGTYNELVTGANLNQRSHHWGASDWRNCWMFFFLLVNHRQAQASFLTARRQGVRHHGAWPEISSRCSMVDGHRDYDMWLPWWKVISMVWKTWIHNNQLHPGWWWLEPWNFMTFHIYIYIGNGIIIPTDEYIFQRGRSTTNQIINYISTGQQYLMNTMGQRMISYDGHRALDMVTWSETPWHHPHDDSSYPYCCWQNHHSSTTKAYPHDVQHFEHNPDICRSLIPFIIPSFLSDQPWLIITSIFHVIILIHYS